MSYARWSWSNWYIFEHACGGDALHERVLAIWYAQDEDIPCLLYGDVATLEVEGGWANAYPNASEDDLRLLSVCVRQWFAELREEGLDAVDLPPGQWDPAWTDSIDQHLARSFGWTMGQVRAWKRGLAAQAEGEE